MQNRLDIIGAAVSVGCLIHCLLVPVVLPLLPMFGLTFGHGPWFHTIIAGVVISVAAVALTLGYKKHKDGYPLYVGSCGAMWLVFSAQFEFVGAESWLVLFVTVCGSICMILAHYTNHKRLCACKHHGKHSCH